MCNYTWLNLDLQLLDSEIDIAYDNCKMSSNRFKLIPAVHLFLINQDQVLLARRFNTGYEDGNYSVPAGHVDGNEPMTTALIREAQEEIGVEILPQDLTFAHVMHRRTTDERVDFFFTCQKWSGQPIICEPDKCDQLQWVSKQNLPNNTILYIRSAWQNILQNIPFSEMGWEE